MIVPAILLAVFVGFVCLENIQANRRTKKRRRREELRMWNGVTARLRKNSCFYPIFPDGIVPVKTWAPVPMDFDNPKEPGGFHIDPHRLTAQQWDAFVAMFSKHLGVTPPIVTLEELLAQAPEDFPIRIRASNFQMEALA